MLILGGRLFKHSVVACGAIAARPPPGGATPTCPSSASPACTRTAGLTTGDADEAAMKRILARRAADTYVLASAEKIGAASRYQVVPLTEVAGVITDAPAADPAIASLAAQGIPIVPAHQD